MLYVSECVEQDLYAIKNSDTGQKTYYSESQLLEMKRKGAIIKGVSKDSVKPYVFKINPPKANFRGKKDILCSMLKQVLDECKINNRGLVDKKLIELVGKLPIGTRLSINYGSKRFGSDIDCIKNIDSKWFIYDNRSKCSSNSGNDSLCAMALKETVCRTIDYNLQLN